MRLSTRFFVLTFAAAVLAPSILAAQARYTATTNGDIVQLKDARTNTIVSVLTPVSNAYEMVVNGHNVIRVPFANLDALRANPGLNGVPLLAPFANRLDETAFYANGRKYNFDLELGNVRGPVPIHGYLSRTDAWKVVEAKADARSAWVTTALEFYRYPLYMAQFPFAHTLRMTYRLQDGALEVRTRIDNLSTEPMPVAIGFHPYFQLTDSVREEWTLSVQAKTNWKLDQRLVPTGETQTAEAFFGADPKNMSMRPWAARTIDDLFSDLERDASGRATFSLKGKSQRLDVVVGPLFKALLIYSPVPGGNRGGGAGRAGGGVAPAVAPPAAGAAGTPALAPGAGGPGAAAQGPQGARGGGGRGGPPQPPVSTGPDLPLNGREAGPVPPNRGTVAFEPMAGISNALNAAHKGQYKELQSVAPGGSWEESFWIRPSGF